jgi:plasmid stabilization system protein ParE
MKLRIESAAEAETQEAAEWYERQRPGLGLEFLVAVDEAIQRIGLSPERFPRLETVPDEESVRRHLLKRFPFAIIYEITACEIRIVAVAHTGRRPNYWADREKPS